jgi:hypothetical protein
MSNEGGPWERDTPGPAAPRRALGPWLAFLAAMVVLVVGLAKASRKRSEHRTTGRRSPTAWGRNGVTGSATGERRARVVPGSGPAY